MAYPTPPHSTSSPKPYHTDFNTDSVYATQSQFQYHSNSVPDSTHIPPVPLSDSYYNPPASDSYYHPNPQDSSLDNPSAINHKYDHSAQDTHSHRPAQETYFTTSLPTSPTLHQEPLPFSVPTTPYSQTWDPSFNMAPSGKPSKPPRPQKQHTLPAFFKPTKTSNASANKPPRPGKYTPPRISSPLRPFSTRPKPRPGLVKRMLKKMADAIRAVVQFGKRHPIMLGGLSFLPVALGVGFVKAVRGVGRLISGKGDDAEGWQEERDRGALRSEKEKAKDKKGRGEVRSWWGEVFEDFRGFGASRLGTESLDGILKVLQMLMNHWCKLSPSMAPRAASILLELYFLDTKSVE